jgi:quercetin dioxygenase-like cupin family protein
MQEWARGVMASRPPDFVIGEGYLNRWHIIPRNDFGNVYLHDFGRSDDDRALHDHPWRNVSYVIEGRYIEHTPDGQITRNAGDVVTRLATAMHRIELFPGERATTLFFTGPKVREWGFDCPQGWRHWRDFTAGENGEIVGRGCGE